jgi:hypothetical protein
VFWACGPTRVFWACGMWEALFGPCESTCAATQEGRWPGSWRPCPEERGYRPGHAPIHQVPRLKLRASWMFGAHLRDRTLR